MGKVIFNSDDFGYNRAVNYGIVDAYTEGILTSTTIMANMPGFDHAVALAKQYLGLGIGVHLTLTCGAPITTNAASITDEHGEFRKKKEYDSGFQGDTDEILREWDAQIDKVLRSGICPTHLDSHHHIHTYPQHREIVAALARKYKLPVRGNFDVPDDIKHVQYFETMFDQVGYEEAERDIKDLDAYLEDLIEKLHQYETVEVMCHCAYLDQMLYQNSSFAFPRINQTAFMIESDFAHRLRSDKQIELVSYRSI